MTCSTWAQPCTCALQQLEKGTLAPVDVSAALNDQTLATDENFPVGSRSCKAESLHVRVCVITMVFYACSMLLSGKR